MPWNRDVSYTSPAVDVVCDGDRCLIVDVDGRWRQRLQLYFCDHVIECDSAVCDVTRCHVLSLTCRLCNCRLQCAIPSDKVVVDVDKCAGRRFVIMLRVSENTVATVIRIRERVSSNRLLRFVTTVCLLVLICATTMVVIVCLSMSAGKGVALRIV